MQVPSSNERGAGPAYSILHVRSEIDNKENILKI
jgi:hypothetical protein